MASTATKIFLIGCGLIVIAGILVVAGGGFYLRHKFHEWIDGATDQSNKGEQLNKDYPFTPPTNGLITENQLQRFLATRRQIYSVYKRYEPEFKKLEQEKERNLSVLTKGWSFWKDLRQE